MVFYKNENDLISKILELKDDMNKINKISKNGKKRYFEIFNNLIYRSILSKTLNLSPKINMHGKNKTICIAGKNECAIIVTYLLKKYPNFEILALPINQMMEMILGKNL